MNFRAAIVSGSLMIAAVTLLRLLGGRRLPRRLFPALWCLTALRLLLPAALPSPLSVWNLLGPAAGSSGAAATRYAFAAAPYAPAGGAVSAPAPSSGSPLALLWLSVAGLLGLFLFVSFLRSLRRFRGAETRQRPETAAWISAYAFARPVTVRYTADRRAPLTYGIFRPVVLLPASLDAADAGLPFILTHELEHIRRWDCLRKLLLAVCLCLHWFNPLVWLMVWLAERDIELACDEAVLLRLGYARRRDYARVLLELAAPRRGSAPLCSGFGKSAAEERIRVIMRAKRIPAAVMVAVLLLAVCGLTVFATQATKPETPEETPAPAAQTQAVPTPAPVEAETPAAPAKAEQPEPVPAPAAAPAPLWVNPLDQTELEVTAAFGRRLHPVFETDVLHDGVDLAAAEGDDIYAVADGIVTEVWFDAGAGNCIRVDHGNGYATAYHHCSEIFAAPGETVTQGQCIAAVGQTGWVTGPHLHLSLYQEGACVDPIPVLSGKS